MIPVDYIKFGGEEHPIKVGYYALKNLQKHSKKGLAAMQDDLSLYEPLLYYSLKIGHILDKKEFKFKMADMEIALEECFFEVSDMLTKASLRKELQEKFPEVGGQTSEK
jgi:hypothetical protein